MEYYSRKRRDVDRVRLPELEFEIEKLEIALSRLRVEHRCVQERLSAYKYPILTLANEVLSEIFLHYIPAYPARPRLGGDDSPQNLTQVCRKWRDIANGTPALWRALDIRCGVHLHTDLPLAVERWMGRSGALPLSIRFDSGYGNFEHEEDLRSVSAVLTAILLYRFRWEYIELRCSPTPSSPRVDGDFPLLAQIDMLADTEAFQNVSGPKIRAVLLRRVYGMETTRNMPWRQITTLYLGDVYPDIAFLILCHTTALRVLRLDILPDDRFDDDIPRTQLLALETLLVGSSTITSTPEEAECISQLLHALHLPKLKRLFIHDDVALEIEDRIPLVSSAIEAFGCKLERLCIAGGTISCHDCVKAFPGIAQIEVVEDYEPDPEIWGCWNTAQYE